LRRAERSKNSGIRKYPQILSIKLEAISNKSFWFNMAAVIIHPAGRFLKNARLLN